MTIRPAGVSGRWARREDIELPVPPSLEPPRWLRGRFRNRGKICAVVKVGDSIHTSWFGGWLAGHAGGHRRLRILRIPNAPTAVMIVLVAIIVAGATSIGASARSTDRGSGFTKHLTTILSNADHATISWKVRSSGNTRLRLYRAQVTSGEVLVHEVIASYGVSSFDFIDENRPPGNVVYLLRVLGEDGRESNLGSALCIESKFAQSDVSSTAGSSQPAWSRIASWTSDPEPSSIGTRSAVLRHGFIPAPEPPVPRSADRPV